MYMDHATVMSQTGVASAYSCDSVVVCNINNQHACITSSCLAIYITCSNQIHTTSEMAYCAVSHGPDWAATLSEPTPPCSYVEPSHVV